ncbi:unnamed protein product (macronuclear) [Paramecium tetraurelia]|uniref:Transmembrane protein n=1 Tax=Paramecium tetraurelia TaxID=5888 RepID=A0C2C3_PARTE|nr:uncharacterized protein GSPATT00034417001 [Paramecium tetraurelia]CAK64940.1 unnamed protein product [Paramecium tetraurelia]|eukprot:XP_001432337.1 hypothetical protein (macronuclear) [Paramecium tetraurelia strain d4-2]
MNCALILAHLIVVSILELVSTHKIQIGQSKQRINYTIMEYILNQTRYSQRSQINSSTQIRLRGYKKLNCQFTFIYLSQKIQKSVLEYFLPNNTSCFFDLTFLISSQFTYQSIFANFFLLFYAIYPNSFKMIGSIIPITQSLFFLFLIFFEYGCRILQEERAYDFILLLSVLLCSTLFVLLHTLIQFYRYEINLRQFYLLFVLTFKIYSY